MRTITAAERTRLIRYAAKLPKGNPKRRAALRLLQKESASDVSLQQAVREWVEQIAKLVPYIDQRTGEWIGASFTVNGSFDDGVVETTVTLKFTWVGHGVGWQVFTQQGGYGKPERIDRGFPKPGVRQKALAQKIADVLHKASKS